MMTWTDFVAAGAALRRSALAIGNFDGVHLGHQALIRSTVDAARADGSASVVLTFDRHPAELIDPDNVPPLLTPPAMREPLVADLGVDHLVVARFDDQLRTLTPGAFIADIIERALHAGAVHIGEGFRFGRDRLGTTAMLEALGPAHGFVVSVVPSVSHEGSRIASTVIRRLIEVGDVVTAARMMGRPYRLIGEVVRGQQLGRQLGFPTANLKLEVRQVIPAHGVYAARADVGGRSYRAACSIGSRPTVAGHGVTIESYLLDFSGDLYGRSIAIGLDTRIRDQRRFASLEALRMQIAADVDQIASITS